MGKGERRFQAIAERHQLVHLGADPALMGDWGNGDNAKPDEFGTKRFNLTMLEGRPQHTREPHRIPTVSSPYPHR